MALVDVIVPAYNAARFLPSALDSVIAQTFTDWRIVLVDDGSQDETPDLIRPYQEKLGPKLLYIRQRNAGLPAARNTAIRHSDAEFLALLDADDVWLPRRLEASVALLQSRPKTGLTYGFVTRIDAQGNLLDTFDRASKHAEGRVAPYIYMKSLDLCCPTVTFRRACVDAVGGFDESMRATEDRDLWLRIASHYDVGLVREIIAYYRISPNAMTTDTDRMLKAQLKFLDKHSGAPGCGWFARRAGLSRIYRQRAEAQANNGQMAEAFRSAMQVIRFPFVAADLRSAFSILLRCLRPSPQSSNLARGTK